MNGIDGCSKQGDGPCCEHKQLRLSCRTSLRISLSSVAFAHHDHLTSHHLTSFRGHFINRESIATTKNMEYLKHNIEQAVAGTDQRTFGKFTRDTMKRVSASLRKVRGHFQHLL